MSPVQDMCCVCMAERKDAALVPCGHKAREPMLQMTVTSVLDYRRAF